MLRTGISMLLVLGCALTAPADSVKKDKPTAESILTEVQKKIDPSGKLEKVKASEFTLNTITNGTEAPLKIITKYPDKIRFISKHDNIIAVRAWDGKTAWQYMPQMGYRELKGKELNELKFQGAYLNPATTFNDLYAKKKLAGNANIQGQECWKLILTPKPQYDSQPLVMYVDKKTKLVIYTEELVDAGGKEIEVETSFQDYQSIDGILVPKVMISEINGKIIESDVVSVKWNIDVNDSIFSPPASLSDKK